MSESESDARLTAGTDRGCIPGECQLCRLLDYRGDEVNGPTLSIEVRREDGGVKIVFLCERCADEMGWADDPTLDPINPTSNSGDGQWERLRDSILDANGVDS